MMAGEDSHLMGSSKYVLQCLLVAELVGAELVPAAAACWMVCWMLNGGHWCCHVSQSCARRSRNCAGFVRQIIITANIAKMESFELCPLPGIDPSISRTLSERLNNELHRHGKM